MKTFLNILGSNSQSLSQEAAEHFDENRKSTPEQLAYYRDEINGIKFKIRIQPFRLSGLFHILTNKLLTILKNSRHTIYYDVDNSVGRYILGDNTYIEQILERLLKDALLLNSGSEVILKISIHQNKYLLFEISNKDGYIPKEIYKQYTSANEISESQCDGVNTFVKAKTIAEAMNGSIEVKSSMLFGTRYIFKHPYYEDKNDKSHQDELKRVLKGKKAFFIGKSKYDTARTQYIFKTYGVQIENISLEDFESKKPDVNKYDMGIMRSADLSPKHIKFFRAIYQDVSSSFRNIIIHELFEDEEKIKLSKSIAHAELYSPVVIGDVEEILHQMYILKNRSPKGINNIDVFDSKSFLIKGDKQYPNDFLNQFKGAHIAITEDSKLDAKILQNILKHDDITVFLAENGAEMLELLEDEEVDFIFTDVHMPIMDGITMTEKIRSNNQWKDIPIVSISSMIQEYELKNMEAVGMNGATPKPFKTNDIYKALEKFFVMTDKVRLRANTNKKALPYDKNILNVRKGLKVAKSDLDYLQTLLHTLEFLKNSQSSFEEMIHDENIPKLRQYVQKALNLSQEIYAPAMMSMFQELNYFLYLKQKAYLDDYISIFRVNLEALEKEINRYIENT